MQALLEKFESKKRYDKHVECLEEHLTNFFSNEETSVFHEVVSFDFHLDVYFIKPKGRAYNMLLTSGMSTFEMTVGNTIPDRSRYRFAELMVLLPKEMKFDLVPTRDEGHGWIISMLKETARFPHHYDTFVTTGHTLQATEDLQPYGRQTEYVGCAVLPSVTFDDDFTKVDCNGNTINIYGLFPLYKNELEFKLQNGYSGLVELLQKANPKEIIDVNRKNMIKSKKSWWK